MKTTISITCFENNNTCNISPSNTALFSKDSQDEAGLILVNKYQDSACFSSIIFVKKTSNNSSDNNSEYKNLRMKIKDNKGIVNTNQELFDKTFRLGEVNAGETNNYDLKITRNSINESDLPSYLDFDAIFSIQCDGKEMTIESIEDVSGKVRGIEKKDIIRAREIESTIEPGIMNNNKDKIGSFNSYFPWLYFLAGLAMFLILLLLILFFYKRRKKQRKGGTSKENNHVDK